MTKRILILGGTKEAAELAKQLDDQGHDVTTSLAGRTKEPVPIKGKTRKGGFGGVDGLASYLVENKIELLIDATHPFAKQISKNAIAAARLAKVSLETKLRPPWQQKAGDNWHMAESLVAARDLIPPDARVLLALGSQHIELFKSRADVFFLVRMVDNPQTELALPNHEILLGRPNEDWADEAALLKQKTITHIVCRNSGGKGAYAKIEAARKLQLPVIMIER